MRLDIKTLACNFDCGSKFYSEKVYEDNIVLIAQEENRTLKRNLRRDFFDQRKIKQPQHFFFRNTTDEPYIDMVEFPEYVSEK